MQWEMALEEEEAVELLPLVRLLTNLSITSHDLRRKAHPAMADL